MTARQDRGAATWSPAVVALALALAVTATVAVPATVPEARADQDPCASASPAPFADRGRIAAVHREAVDCLHHLGIVRGYTGPDGRVRFGPTDDVSRGQFVAMVHRMLQEAGQGGNLDEVRRPRFTDVRAGHTFDDEIHTLAYAGVIKGVDAESFAPGAPVRRDQTASLLMRTAEWSADRELVAVAGPHFGDIRGNVHREAIEAAFEYGLLQGTRRPCGELGGRYAPRRHTQRQQAATLLVRAMGALEEIRAGGGGDERGDPECPQPEWLPRVDAARDYAEARAGGVSFAAIGTDGRMVGHRAGTRVSAASVIKVMFLVAYLRQPDVADRDLRRSDRDLLEPMIRRSANTPATRIADQLGPGPMNRLAERAGMRDFAYTRPWGSSQTSARDQVRFMHDLERHLPARHRDYALGLLADIVPEQRWGIGQVSTGDWARHYKGGWGSGTGAVNHQVVLLRHPEGSRGALAVMTTNSPSHDHGSTTLHGVFRRLLEGL